MGGGVKCSCNLCDISSLSTSISTHNDECSVQCSRLPANIYNVLWGSILLTPYVLWGQDILCSMLFCTCIYTDNDECWASIADSLCLLWYSLLVHVFIQTMMYAGASIADSLCHINHWGRCSVPINTLDIGLKHRQLDTVSFFLKSKENSKEGFTNTYTYKWKANL